MQEYLLFKFQLILGPLQQKTDLEGRMGVHPPLAASKFVNAKYIAKMHCNFKDFPWIYPQTLISTLVCISNTVIKIPASNFTFLSVKFSIKTNSQACF